MFWCERYGSYTTLAVGSFEPTVGNASIVVYFQKRKQSRCAKPTPPLARPDTPLGPVFLSPSVAEFGERISCS